MVIAVWSRKESFDMQLNETEKKADFIADRLKIFFGKRVDNVVIENVIDVPGHTYFSIKFKAYNYFAVRLNYGVGSFGCCICTGGIEFGLDNSQKYWDTADFDVFFKELKQEIELRIPDKFLKAKGWL